MKFRLLFPALLLIANTLFAQNGQVSPFMAYANQQSTLQHDAYTKKDVPANQQLVADMIGQYNALSKAEKGMFKGYIINAYYNLSCLYSLVNDKPKAIQYLDSAVTYGYSDYAHLMADSDFANIKTDPQFIKIGYDMRAVGDYMFILKNSAVYNFKDDRKIPEFTYQPASSPALVAIRKKFNLDSVAGKGDEASKAINLLHWVHNTVMHDGQHESGIKYINADVIISTATAKKIGVSCGELATALNECYLSMGWKSKKVYCFPKDSLAIDFDSHVINTVYVPSLKKWVWMDPTNDAYVSDENGHLLGIGEVRERLINGKPLQINADANWNHRVNVVKEDYLYNYMAKNLYRLYIPLHSEVDYQTPGTDKTVMYVHLLPVNYFKKLPDKVENHNKDTNSTAIHYMTTNPDVFWK